jgi:hypothetical protein
MPDVTKIVVADEHFLYLPLYYAQEKNFYGFLPAGCEISIVRSEMYTDASAFRMLMDNSSPARRGIDFAVCDPAYVLTHQEPRSHPVVLASLITHSAFWAVNHKSKNVEYIDDLAAFDNIISFKKGSTSFGIANRIFGEHDKAGFIIEVNPKEELSLLVESPPSTVALSPDILGIHKMLETSPQCRIELALAETIEYRDMLVTALLTRRDVIENKLELVRGLLKALQIALVSVKNTQDDVVRFASNRFGRDRDLVQSALAEASRCEVYPATIRVSQTPWMKAAEVFDSARGMVFDQRSRDHALHVYRHSIEPFSKLATDIVKEMEIATLKKPPEDPSYWRTLVPMLPAGLLTALFLVHALTYGLLPWYGYAGALITVGLASWQMYRIRLVPWTLSGFIFWSPIATMAVAMGALADISAASSLGKSFLPFGLDPAWSKGGLATVIIGAGFGAVKYLEKLRHRQKAR